jgi:hypothetical protein
MTPEPSLECDALKINVRQADDGSMDVSVFLTETEADEVAKALRLRLDDDPGHRGPGYHLHVEDGEGSELTIGVLDPE